MWHSTRRQLEQVAAETGGTFSPQDARDVGMSTRTFYRLRDAGQIIPISRGVYQLASDDGNQATPDYAAIAVRVPRAVLCTVSALYHHELTTEIPRQIHLALDRGMSVPQIDYPPVRVYRMSSVMFNAGIERKEIGDVTMRIFNPEKTLADCFKYRSQLGTDLAIEAIKRYLARPSANPSSVLAMAKVCRVEKIMRPYLEALL